MSSMPRNVRDIAQRADSPTPDSMIGMVAHMQADVEKLGGRLHDIRTALGTRADALFGSRPEQVSPKNPEAQHAGGIPQLAYAIERLHATVSLIEEQVNRL